MPIYEYHCDACGHDFELMQKMSDSAVQTCEKCRKKKARRVISQTSFMLKGSGWYATDYAGRKAHGGAEKAPAAPACPAASSCASGTCSSKKAS